MKPRFTFRTRRRFEFIGLVLFFSLLCVTFYLRFTRSPTDVNASYPSNTQYCLAVVSDEDERTKQPDGSFVSYSMFGLLTFDNKWKIEWERKPSKLISHTGYKDRGMELSELVYFNNKLYTCDDRTGIVYELTPTKPIRRYLLNDGDGEQEKGFKCEWMTVKDDLLYIGSIGKEWTFPKNDTVRNDYTLYVKTIDKQGNIQHLRFHDEYTALRRATGTLAPGYMIHEAAVWSPTYRRWFFLPRRVSTQRYNDEEDEKRGSNKVIIADETFKNVEVRAIGRSTPTRGFSSVAILPHRPDTFIALKSEEVKGKVSSYFTMFKIDGTVLINELEMGSFKFEGVEVVPLEFCADYYNKGR
ncbi:hypothetical protein RCL1_006667 [Eukaryota sp. TZLM3-RCL]